MSQAHPLPIENALESLHPREAARRLIGETTKPFGRAKYLARTADAESRRRFWEAVAQAVAEIENSEPCDECGRRPAESVDGGMLGERFLCAGHARRAVQIGEAF